MSNPKCQIVPGATKDRILQLAATHPCGLHSDIIAITVDASAPLVRNRCTELGRAGMLAYVNDPSKESRRRVRWCLPRDIETCKAAVQASGGNGLRGKNVPAKPENRPAGAGIGGWKAKGSTKRADAPAAEPAKLFVPSCLDTRYTVHQVTPFFSAMTPGSYIRTGSAIERAYGGRE